MVWELPVWVNPRLDRSEPTEFASCARPCKLAVLASARLASSWLTACSAAESVSAFEASVDWSVFSSAERFWRALATACSSCWMVEVAVPAGRITSAVVDVLLVLAYVRVPDCSVCSWSVSCWTMAYEIGYALSLTPLFELGGLENGSVTARAMPAAATRATAAPPATHLRRRRRLVRGHRASRRGRTHRRGAEGGAPVVAGGVLVICWRTSNGIAGSQQSRFYKMSGYISVTTSVTVL